MPDNWDDVEVWKRVKGANQVRQRVVDGVRFLDLKTDGDVLRIRLSADDEWDDDVVVPERPENPVPFGSIDFSDDFYEPQPAPPAPQPAPPSMERKVKIRQPNGAISPWMPFSHESAGLLFNVVAVQVGCDHLTETLEDMSTTAALRPNEYITNATVSLMQGVPMPLQGWDGVSIQCTTAEGPTYP